MLIFSFSKPEISRARKRMLGYLMDMTEKVIEKKVGTIAVKDWMYADVNPS